MRKMRHQNPYGQRAQQVVKVPIAATGFIADLEAIREAAEDSHHFFNTSHPRAVGHLPCLVEGAHRNVLRVNNNNLFLPIASIWLFT